MHTLVKQEREKEREREMLTNAIRAFVSGPF